MGNVIRDTNFKEISETKSDSKNRLTLGRCRVKAHH